jgi:hypothetical protein
MSREIRALRARIDRLEPKLPKRRFPPGKIDLITSFSSMEEFLEMDMKSLSDEQLADFIVQSKAGYKACTGEEMPEDPEAEKAMRFAAKRW